MSTTRKSYPSDVTDAEWEFLIPYLTLMREDAPQREHPLRELFNSLRNVHPGRRHMLRVLVGEFRCSTGA